MNLALARGACPTLAAPMQTGDGLLARLNPVAVGLSPTHLIGLCEAALRHGNGIVEVTARGSFQIRGLSAASGAMLAAEVDALGIAVRSGVPVEAGPLAGFDPDEVADPRPLAESIRRCIAAAGLEGRLGPKVSVVVDGGSSWLDGVKADVRLTARGNGMWQLAVGGDAVTARKVGDLAEGKAAALVIAVLAEIAGLGRQGRATALASDTLTRAAAQAAKAEGGAVKRQGPSSAPSSREPIPLTDGRTAIPIALPFGHSRAETLIELARATEALGAGEIRLASKRTLLFLLPSTTAALQARDTARRLGFIVAASDPRARIAGCPGTPACASGHIAARVIAAEIAAAIPADAALDLHVSGCEKRCAKPSHDGLTLLGQPGGTALVLGKRDAAPLAQVAHEQAVAAIGRVARLIAAERKPGETDGACLARVGERRLANIFTSGETPDDQ